MQVATRSPSPASPANVGGSAPSADAEPGGLGEPAGDERGLGVVAHAHALGHADGEGDDVLDGAAELAADDVGVGVGAEVRAPRRRPATRSADVLVGAGDDAWRPAAAAAISRARLGPETTAIRSGSTPATSAMTSLIRLVVPSSTPFIRRDERGVARQEPAPSARGWRAASATARRARRSRRPSAASAGSVVARDDRSGSAMPGQVVGVGAGVDRLDDLRRGGPTSRTVVPRRRAPRRRRCPSCRCRRPLPSSSTVSLLVGVAGLRQAVLRGSKRSAGAVSPRSSSSRGDGRHDAVGGLAQHLGVVRLRP